MIETSSPPTVDVPSPDVEKTFCHLLSRFPDNYLDQFKELFKN